MDTKFTKINLRCLGAEFAKYRKISGIRQEDAAKAVGKTRGWLSQVEIGALNISLVDALHLCDLYKCDIRRVIDDAEKTTKELKGMR